jgi:uncharacterized membrane protein YphA (DoxX/SURF4 family)
VLVGGYFVYASLEKIANPAAFARIVYQWQVIGPVASNLLAIMLPWVELLAGLLLVAGVWKRESAAVLAAATSVLFRGIDVANCGCTSLASEPPSAWTPTWTRGVGWFLVTRNLILLGLAALLAWARAEGETRMDSGKAAS